MWAVKHKSGTVLFVTNCERTANNRREMGWIVEKKESSLDVLLRNNAENQRAVTVNVGLLKAALSEIEVHARVNGEGLMTRAIVNALKEAIGK
ncbi:hypothetical protein KpnSVR6602_36 [Klebsiella phage KpnS_VR6602]|nr:hypothetical protein KpnSVR6602_36 [Klebsiella phage KpnS_VR6602]DAV66156.1 MAG TPA: hypothetical protein [Caudoviricetes sp.]